ncbi:hypothetical protein [Acidianus sp. RZ1]|uniref:hypothetical protein n=1 Tax=Acidianus sp. RZ1 TaxID=1540082 RepID=UPI00149160ED|nr:hypothetical protein [Acidianus sp. RZ1]NON62302.1 hypothetical protein [Acidianus sp. RZ1]
MQKYITIDQSYNCPSNYGIFECEDKNCNLLMCLGVREDNLSWESHVPFIEGKEGFLDIVYILLASLRGQY